MVAVITGGDRLGKCNISGSYITNFTYFCFTNNYTYTVVIPGNSNDKDLNGSLWSCEGFLNGERQMIQHISKCKCTADKYRKKNVDFSLHMVMGLISIIWNLQNIRLFNIDICVQINIIKRVITLIKNVNMFLLMHVMRILFRFSCFLYMPSNTMYWVLTCHVAFIFMCYTSTIWVMSLRD